MSLLITLAEIKSAIKGILDAHDRWVSQDYPGDHLPPDYFGEAMHRSTSCGSDPATGQRKELPIDQQALSLLESLLNVLREWTHYQSEAEGWEEGMPLTDEFRKAFRTMQGRYGLPAQDKANRTQIESVRQLKAELVSDTQIARMYGTMVEGEYQGIFFHPGGKTNFDAIKAEAENPGSVITKDWRHPAEIREEQERRQQVENLTRHLTPLAQVFLWPEDTAAPEDPESVEEHLRQGNYPEIIARVKNVTVEEVKAEAKRLGIPLNSKENPHRWQYVARDEEPEAVPVAVQELSSEDVTAMIFEERERDPEAKAGQIAERVNARTGLNLTSQKVAKVLHG